MTARLFTVDEANEALATIRPLAEEMVRRRRAILAAVEQRSEIALTAAGNGAGLDPRRLGALDELVEAERNALARCVSAIQLAGVQVKDLDTGLVDFPSFREGEEILLCWRVGEPEVAWWHPVEEGFAGRQTALIDRRARLRAPGRGMAFSDRCQRPAPDTSRTRPRLVSETGQTRA